MIKAVVFDLGGVLFSEGKSVAMERLANEQGYDRAVIARILTSDQAMDLRRGTLSDETFWSWAQQQLPEHYDAELVKKAWYDSYVQDPDIRRLIENLRGKYKIIAFSGNIRSRVQYLEEKYAFRHLFDLEIYSFEHHVTKPDQRFVRIMIEKAGCPPSEIAYIDDNDRYAEPARELGVRVALYARGKVRELESELEALGVRW